MKINIRKIILTALISFAVLSLNPKTAEAISAWVTNDINPIDNMNSIMEDLGIDKTELKYNIQTFNTTRTKKQQPQVSISFYPEDPKPGQKVTATATPVYFLNDAKDTYFTWYLKLKGCDEGSKPTAQCDDNRDGTVDVEDWKTKAARIIANDGFEWDSDGNGIPNSSIYGSNTDRGSSYEAIWGGNDQGGKNAYCYYHDVRSGNEYEIACGTHLFPDAKGCFVDINNNFRCMQEKTGNGSFPLDEEMFWRTDPHNSDTAGTSNGDEANVAGLGITQLAWNYSSGDKVGVVVEGISLEPTQKKPYDSSYKIMWAFSKDKCDLEIDDKGDNYPKTDVSTSDQVSVGVGITCPDGTNQQKKVRTTTTYDKISQVEATLVIRTRKTYQDITDANCDGIVAENEDVGSEYGQTTTCPYFPPSYDEGNIPNYSYNGATCTGIDETTSFDAKFEGSLLQTHDFNKCLGDNLVDPKEEGPLKKMDISLSYSPEFPMNDDPGGSGYNKDGDGDNLIIQSSITNANNGSYLKYEWQLYEDNDPNPSSWTPILSTRLPSDLKTSGFGLDSLKLRLNIPGLKKYLRAKLTVSENAEGTTIARKSSSDVVIPISNITQRIKVYTTAVGDNLSLSQGSTKRCETTVGTQTQVDPVCLIAKNEIITLSVDNSNGELTDFLWTVNNAPLQPPKSQEVYKSTAFLPVLEDNGYQYTVELTATNIHGEKIDLLKTFEVADPEIQIASADEYVCKPNLIGHYIDLDGTYWPDYSKANFSAVSDTDIKMKANFYGFVPTQSQYSWYVDGYEITKSNAPDYGYKIEDDGTIILASKPIGSAYNLTAGYLFSQDKNTKKALSEYWGVTLDKFYEKKIASSILITFVGSISETEGASKNNLPKKIIASIYSSTPAYIAFLLRIVLTAFAMLIFSKIILSFFPNIQKNEY
jgi:hypothetical protein